MSMTQLAIGGMTCASCAARIERRLNKLDGVTATVNFATETAQVQHPETVKAVELVHTIASTGYTRPFLNHVQRLTRSRQPARPTPRRPVALKPAGRSCPCGTG